MMSNVAYLCQYCKSKKNFKNQHYLDRHQSTSQKCLYLQQQQQLLNLNNRNNNDDNEALSHFSDPRPVDDSSVGLKAPRAEAELLNDQCTDASMQLDDDQSGGDNAMIYDSPSELFDDWGLSDDDNDDEAELLDPRQKYLRNFQNICRYARDYAPSFTEDDIASIELLQLLKEKKAPLDSYDGVLDWHEQHCPPRDRLEKPKTRPQIIKMLQDRYNFPKKLAEEHSVLLPHSKAKVNVICHDAEAAVVSLLTDPRFGDDDFLHFNNDPLAPPPGDLDYIADINTGRCYIETYKDLITDPKKQMLVPVIFYIDGAVAGQFEKLQVKPLKMTLGIFNRKARDKEYAWRTIGYVPNYTPADTRAITIIEESGHFASDLFHGANEQHDAAAVAVGTPTFGEGSHFDGDDDHSDGEEDYNINVDYELIHDKAQDLHTILDTILSKSKYKNLEERGMVWDYRYRGKVHRKIEFKFFSFCIKCDTDEADECCGKYKVRNGKVAQLCRYCVCPTDNTDDVSWLAALLLLLSHFISEHSATLLPSCFPSLLLHQVFAAYSAKTADAIRNLVEQAIEGKRASLLSDASLYTQAQLRAIFKGQKAEKALKDMSQHCINNAFHSLRFGSHNNQGVHGACPMEMLHHILLGVFKLVRDCFLFQLGRTSQIAKEINSLAKLLGRVFSRQSERDLPKTNFAKGIFEGKIMGKEFTGVLLLIAAILQTEKGRALLKKASPKRFGRDCLLDDWALLVETLIEWEAFLKLERMELKNVKRLKRKHRFIMFLIKKIADRSTGMKLKLVKFHAILHLVEDLLNFGVPLNVDTGPNESHHKPIKNAARRTQRDVKKFELQTAIRLMEFLLIELAIAELADMKLFLYFDLTLDRGPARPPSAEDATSVLTTGASIRVYHDGRRNNRPTFKFRRDPSATSGAYPPELLDYLLGLQDHLQQQQVGVSDLDVRTEHKRGSHMFRAHPDYRKSGMRWNDWAEFEWRVGGRRLKCPCEIWCFVDLSTLPSTYMSQFRGSSLSRGTFAVVESSIPCPNKRRELVKVGKTWRPAVDNDGQPSYLPMNTSDLFQPILKEVGFSTNGDDEFDRKFYLADVEAIVRPCCVIPDVPHGDNCSCSSRRYFLVKPRREWSTEFLHWVNQPHSIDETNMGEEGDV